MTDRKRAIVVYGASSSQIAQKFKDAAREVGRALARAGYTTVCGGGRGGLMAEAIEGATEEGGRTIGVLPQFMVDREWQHPQLTEMIATPDMHSRKARMASLVDGVIACPGGCGTLEELLEMITWHQLELFSGPVVILNVDGYYDPLIEMLQRTIDYGFRRGSKGAEWQVATTAGEAVALATA